MVGFSDIKPLYAAIAKSSQDFDFDMGRNGRAVARASHWDAEAPTAGL